MASCLNRCVKANKRQQLPVGETVNTPRVVAKLGWVKLCSHHQPIFGVFQYLVACGVDAALYRTALRAYTVVHGHGHDHALVFAHV